MKLFKDGIPRVSMSSTEFYEKEFAWADEHDLQENDVEREFRRYLAGKQISYCIDEYNDLIWLLSWQEENLTAFLLSH